MASHQVHGRPVFLLDRAMKSAAGPGEVSPARGLEIVVGGELRAGGVGEYLLHALLIFVPTVVLQGGDIEEHGARALIVHRRRLGRIESAPGSPVTIDQR